MKTILLYLSLPCILLAAAHDSASTSSHSRRHFEIWEPEPAPNRGHSFEKNKSNSHFFIGAGYPVDPDWEQWSYPIGNGYLGATLFGRTDVERIQVTEKTLYNTGPFGGAGLTNFAELYLDIGHREGISNYKRSLSLEDAIHRTEYTYRGIRYRQHAFASYPDNVLVVHTTASKSAKVSFGLRPEIPYLKSKKERDRRTGTVKAQGNQILIAGTQAPYSLNYGAHIRVLHKGGTLITGDDNISIRGADSVTIIAAFGTNYELNERALQEPVREKKVDATKTPDAELKARVDAAVALGYGKLQSRHVADYQQLYQRVHFTLDSTDQKTATIPTSQLVKKDQSSYIEELMFQYGRYLLIASSRETTLPAGLQGAWTQSEVSPWTGAYWHNINLQMNYWGAMSANLAETFEAYIEYFKAYKSSAQLNAEKFIRRNYRDQSFEADTRFGWTIGTSGNLFGLSTPGLHSGPGTGGLTSKLFVDYYDFTRDEEFLREVGYPAVLGMSEFLSNTLQAQADGTLLVSPSYSPEIIHRGPLPEYATGKVNKSKNKDGGYYQSVGTTFDQGFVWENYNDTLRFAKKLGIQDPFLAKIDAEITKLDPILIGESGQLKEFREEKYYGDIGNPKHRHISHLCTLYPGTLVNDTTPEWLEAAKVALEKRGPDGTGWAIAHRMLLWARVKDGEKAIEMYRGVIDKKTLPNLWTTHPPFQIDASLGIMAGVAEMLLQSHSGYLQALPALPNKWADGSFSGLVARGSFVVDASWKHSSLQQLLITSRAGEVCKVHIPADTTFRIIDTANGKPVRHHMDGQILNFTTRKGGRYQIDLSTKEALLENIVLYYDFEGVSGDAQLKNKAFQDFNGSKAKAKLTLENSAKISSAESKVGSNSLDLTSPKAHAFLGGKSAFFQSLTDNNASAVSFWIKHSKVFKTVSFELEESSTDTTAKGRGFQAHTPFSDQNFYFDFGIGAMANRAKTTNPPNIDPLNWNHVVLQAYKLNDQFRAEIWINGILAANRDFADTNKLQLFTGNLIIGGQFLTDVTANEQYTAANQINGYIDEFAVFNRQMSAPSIVSLANGAAIATAIPSDHAF